MEVTPSCSHVSSCSGQGPERGDPETATGVLNPQPVSVLYWYQVFSSGCMLGQSTKND